MVLSSEGFMKKNKAKDETLTKSDVQTVYNYSIYPRDSKITTDRFGNLNNDSMGGIKIKLIHLHLYKNQT